MHWHFGCFGCSREYACWTGFQFGGVWTLVLFCKPDCGFGCVLVVCEHCGYGCLRGCGRILSDSCMVGGEYESGWYCWLDGGGIGCMVRFVVGCVGCLAVRGHSRRRSCFGVPYGGCCGSLSGIVGTWVACFGAVFVDSPSVWVAWIVNA